MKKLSGVQRQEEFKGLLTSEGAESVAEYILSNFSKSDDSRLLDYDFNLKNGIMLSSVDSNTAFSIDFEYGTVGRDIVDALADELLDVTDELSETFMEFLELVAEKIMFRKEELARKLANALGNGAMEFKSIKIDSVVLMDLPSIDWVLTVNKYAIKGYAHEPVTEELIKEYLRTGDDLDVILKRKKATGELRFMLVESVAKKKALYECEVRMTVDFSAM